MGMEEGGEGSDDMDLERFDFNGRLFGFGCMIRVRVFLGSDGGWFLGFLAKVGGLGKMMEATIFFLLVVCV